MKNRFRIRGYIKVWITRVTGKKELVFEDHNAIQAAYAIAIVDALQSDTNYAFEDMFNGNTNLGAGNNGEDGIAIKESGGLWYEMLMSSSISVGKVTFTGQFTGVTITVADANSVLLGSSWNNGGSTFDTLIAKPTAWSSQVVDSAEILTIEWVIDHTGV